MNQIDDKVIYHLWWEYLKRSSDYRAFCEWLELRKTEPNTPPPKRIQEYDGELKDHPFTFLFTFFYNPHAEKQGGRPYSFKAWWARFEKTLNAVEAKRRPQAVINFGELLQQEMDGLIRDFSQTAKREPTLEEFKSRLLARLTKGLPPKLLAEVDVTGEETGILVRQFNQLLIDEKKRQPVQFWMKFMARENWPRTKIQCLELKRFLVVFDLVEKGLAWPEIVMKVGTPSQRETPSDENVQIVFREDLSKAKAIVSNVEQGSFPGFYGKYSID